MDELTRSRWRSRASAETLAEFRAELALRSAHASAALEGSMHDIEDVRAGVVTDPVLQGALRVGIALPGLVNIWRRAPGQALAALHLRAGRGMLPDGELGRPVWSGDDGAARAARLAALTEIVVAPAPESVPAVIVAAVVHGEILDVAPFAALNGIVARGAARLCMLASGLDLDGLAAPEEVHWEREAEYVGSLGAYATGRPDGVRSWLKHCCLVAERSAEKAAALAARSPSVRRG